MPFPQLEPDHWWEGLQRLPLPEPLWVPLWLVLPADWRQQAVLLHTGEQLCANPALRITSIDA